MQSVRLTPLVALAPVLALFLGLLGKEAVPKLEDTPRTYARRLLEHGTAVTEDLYWRILLLIPGSANVTVTRQGTATSPDPAPSPQDTLKQQVAKNEEEISMQQEVSAKRYAEVQRENADKAEVVLPEQPDEVRRLMDPVDPAGPEMRCGEAIPPESSVTTRNIELIARSAFEGGNGEHFGWKYTITFANHGTETVQMLTRHWVFVNAKGRLESEVKGPGARGVTPVLPPGGEWSYESGTSLTSSYGSMHGSFQFEVLKGDTSPGGRSFSARVGRLLLSHSINPRKVPCPDMSDTDLLPATSVLVTERIIIGQRCELVKKRKGSYRFTYDVQINNARETPVEVVGHSWELVDSAGKRHLLAEGDGVGGVYRRQTKQLPAGDAFRTRGELVSPTPQANAQGTFRVIVQGEGGLPAEIAARTDWVGLSAEGAEARVANFVLNRELL